jgi:hypothetical protein
MVRYFTDLLVLMLVALSLFSWVSLSEQFLPRQNPQTIKPSKDRVSELRRKRMIP